MSEEIENTPEVTPELIEETPAPAPPAKKAAKKAAAKKAAKKAPVKKTAKKVVSEVVEEEPLSGEALIRSLATSPREAEKMARSYSRGLTIGIVAGKHLVLVPSYVSRGGIGMLRLKYGKDVEVVK